MNLTHEPFLRLWEQKVLGLLLDEGKIEPSLVEQIRSWRHRGFNVDRSVCLQAGDRDAIERLAQYMARSPLSLARLVRITPAGKVLYKAEKDHCQRYPRPASADLFGGVARNYQLFEPLDFLAELTQHIPNQGEHLVRYYGCYSNKARGIRAKLAAAKQADLEARAGADAQDQPSIAAPARLDRRCWAMLIKRIYQADPLRCPKCGGTMKIIAFIEARQGELIRKLLEHCGLWHVEDAPWRDPPSRAPPRALGPSRAVRSIPKLDPGLTYEVDPDFLEHVHHEEHVQPELPWEPSTSPEHSQFRP